MFGYVMAIVIVAVVLTVGFASLRWARGNRSRGFWQFNLAQVLLLFTVGAILGGILRWWYLNEYMHWGER